MKKCVKIILGVTGGFILLNGVSIMSLLVSGMILKQYFPKETELMISDISELDKSQFTPEGDKLILRQISNGIKIGK